MAELFQEQEEQFAAADLVSSPTHKLKFRNAKRLELEKLS